MNQATEDISVEQFISRLDSLKEGGDKEYLHLDAEKVLLDYLRQSGRSDLADAFERAKYRVGFWYE